MLLRTPKTRQVQNIPETSAPTTPKSTNTINDDEIVNTIRRVFWVDFHERKISDTTKSNMKLTNIHLDKISAEVVEITKSFEFIQNKLDEAMKDLAEDLLDPNLVPDKLIELKDRSGRNNLWIDGITEQTNET